jgi:hypothetical protein
MQWVSRLQVKKTENVALGMGVGMGMMATAGSTPPQVSRIGSARHIVAFVNTHEVRRVVLERARKALGVTKA